jgi:enoyl-CoA hydratase
MEHNQNRSYSRALEIEYRVFCRMVQRSDVVEGVTAVLIDKRHAPSWDPPTLEAVTPAFVDALFRPLQPSESGYPELQLNVQ